MVAVVRSELGVSSLDSTAYLASFLWELSLYQRPKTVRYLVAVLRSELGGSSLDSTAYLASFLWELSLYQRPKTVRYGSSGKVRTPSTRTAYPVHISAWGWTEERAAAQ